MATEGNFHVEGGQQRVARRCWDGNVSAGSAHGGVSTSHSCGGKRTTLSFSLGPLTGHFLTVSDGCTWPIPTSKPGNDSCLLLLYARRGTQYIKQAETVLTVSAGDSLILDSTKTSALTFCSETDALLLAIPRSWIRGWLPAPELVVGQIFKAGATWAGTLNSALGNLRAESIAELSLSGSILAEQLAGLLALATPATTPTPLNSHRRSLLGRLVDVLRERCHDPALDPAAVAASLRLSRRYVHALFAAMGTTFSRELYNLRLQRARRLLEDQRFAGLSINEIAWNCGFNETSHFRRRFRRQFGVSPNEFRHTTTKI